MARFGGDLTLCLVVDCDDVRTYSPDGGYKGCKESFMRVSWWEKADQGCGGLGGVVGEQRRVTEKNGNCSG